jgi:hypothetical protein
MSGLCLFSSIFFNTVCCGFSSTYLATVGFIGAGSDGNVGTSDRILFFIFSFDDLSYLSNTLEVISLATPFGKPNDCWGVS